MGDDVFIKTKPQSLRTDVVQVEKSTTPVQGLMATMARTFGYVLHKIEFETTAINFMSQDAFVQADERGLVTEAVLQDAKRAYGIPENACPSAMESQVWSGQQHAHRLVRVTFCWSVQEPWPVDKPWP